MEKEKENCFRFIYLMVEVVPEILRFRLKQSYRNSNPKTLPYFLNETDVIHTLFHLFYPSCFCCWNGCRIHGERPKGFSKEQWNILYDSDSNKCCKKNPKDQNKICICCFTPKNIDEKDLDLSLLCLILNNCSNLKPNEKQAVQQIREMKNDHVSHIPSCRLSKSDFLTLWGKAELYIRHLDSTNIYLHQRQNLLKGPFDESLMQQYFVHCLDTMSEIKYIKETVDEMKSIMIDTQRQEPGNAVNKRKRDEPTKCSDVSNEKNNIDADDYSMFNKRKCQKLNCLHLHKGQTDAMRFKQPDIKPFDNYKEYISSNLLGSKVPTSFSLQMDYQVCTMKDLSKQPGFKEANKFICGKCCWLTISLDEFIKHVQQCEMRQKENIKVKNDYKEYVVARITVPTKDKDLSSKIEKEWQQGNINPQHSSIDVNYITTGCVEIWVKVDLVFFVKDTRKVYPALDYLVNDIFQKYAIKTPLYRVDFYDLATGYVDNLADEFHCGDCELKCNTLDNFISHKKTRCFQHILSENFDNAVVSEVDYKKCNDSDLDLPKKNKSRLVIRDIGYSSGTSILPINPGHISTESDCGDIRKLIKKVNNLGEQIPTSENESDKRERRSPVKRKSKFPPKINVINSFDDSSDDSNEEAYKFSTATYDQDLLCDSVLELDVNSDVSLLPTTLTWFYDTEKQRRLNQRTHKPLSAFQFSEVSDKKAETLTKSNISKLFESSTWPKWDIKSELYDTILRRKKTVTSTEDIPDSKTFDQTLVITLLRNLTQMNPPSCCFNRLSSAMETPEAADLARLKHYGNYLAHLDDGKVERSFFNTAWDDITSAIERYGGMQLKLECDHMKTKPLEQTNQNVIMDIKCSNSEIRDMRKSLEMIQQSHTEMKLDHELLEEKNTVLTKEMEERKISQNETVPRNIEDITDAVILHAEDDRQSALDLISNMEAEFPELELDLKIPDQLLERAHHDIYISEWKQDTISFVETRATRHILGCLQKSNCIVVTGSSGCGKSSNIHLAALTLNEKFEYEIIPVLTGPTDILNYYNENKRQVFVVDDICGKELINTHTLQMWRDYSEKLEKIFLLNEKDDDTIVNISSAKLLMSCRLHIYKESQFQLVTLFTRKECNLLSNDLCLLQEERICMAKKYIPHEILEDVKQYMQDVDFFPLLCKLAKDKSFEEVKKLFTDPVQCITQNINHIVNENKFHFCALVLCILFDDGFNTNWLKIKSAPEGLKCKLEGIVKEYDIDLSKEMSRNSLKTSFITLDGTYLKSRGTEYRIIHDIIYKMAAVICGQHLKECFIKYAPSVFIRDHFIFESLTENQANDDLIVISEDQEEDYFERLLRDLRESVITSTFHNAQLIYQSFMDKLIIFFDGSKNAKTCLKEMDSERRKGKGESYKNMNMFKTTPLLESASRGYFSIVHFLIYDIEYCVNNTDDGGRSPLYKASEGGHLKVVRLLLENNAVPRCDDFGDSPLYVACKGGHVDTVELLLQNTFYVSESNMCDEGSIYEDCEGDHADVNQLYRPVESALHVACREGHTDIVQLLLQYNANVTDDDVDGQSPLHVACHYGHIDIVKLLLQKDAPVNFVDEDERYPLHIASEEGHTDVVKLLLQYNAHVSDCNNLDESSLDVAFHRRHFETMKVLLKSSYDYSLRCYGQCGNHFSCEQQYTELDKLFNLSSLFGLELIIDRRLEEEYRQHFQTRTHDLDDKKDVRLYEVSYPFGFDVINDSRLTVKRSEEDFDQQPLNLNVEELKEKLAGHKEFHHGINYMDFIPGTD